jgi:hypothetical protein
MLALGLLATALNAQSKPTDFSGRWVVTALRPHPDELDTLSIVAASELLVVQTPQQITIQHPVTQGTHPQAGTFEFGSGGWVGGLPGGRDSSGTWDTRFAGTQLMISRTTRTAANGTREDSATGSIWQLDGNGRLVIEFREERPNERPKIAARVYERASP